MMMPTSASRPTPTPSSSTHRKPLLAALLVLTLGAGIVVGRASADPRLAGSLVGHPGTVRAASASIVVPDELQRPDLVQPFDDLFQAYHDVTTASYYAPLPDRKRLIYAAINGMLTGGTGDPHTIFISPEDNAALQSSMNGTFEGIGAYVETTSRGIAVIPLPGSPAARAGLRAGDLIVRINGQDATAITADQAAALLRGPAGTSVTLGIRRGGVHGVFSVVVTRGRITVPNVAARMIGRIAYLQIAQFAATTGTDVSTALHRLLTHHPVGLILDLRDNPGGYVDTAVDINSQFLPQDDIILWEQNGRRQLDAPMRSLGGGQATMVPMAVLVNDGTASAAEITAGALQDNRRATIIGITTYGKGSVQQESQLADNSSLRITVRLWLTPHKHLIQNHGITPDIIVDSPVADGSARDAQLARALGFLKTSH